MGVHSAFHWWNPVIYGRLIENTTWAVRKSILSMEVPVSNQPLFPIIDGRYKMEREPEVRIGMILAEDNHQEVLFELPEGEYILSDGEKESTVGKSEGWAVRLDGKSVELFNADGNRVCRGENVIRVAPRTPQRPSRPGEGIRVKNMVAGRGFHWHKRIEQTLTGTVEFTEDRGKVVMINILPLEDYLLGVITSEMSGECPVDFMKSQAVAARSWLLATPFPTHANESFDWCNDDHCQRYQGSEGWSERAIQAIADCRGEVLITPSGKYCDARYSKSCGGISEDSLSVWGMHLEGLTSIVDAPEDSETHQFSQLTESRMKEYVEGSWLKSAGIYCSPEVVPEPTLKRYLGRVDEEGQYFRWSRTIGHDELCAQLIEKANLQDLDEIIDLRPGKRGKSGRLESLDVEYRTFSGEIKGYRINLEYHIRAMLARDFLYSSAFILEHHRDSHGKLKEVTLKGAGWGHGAGLCQIGALGMALKGISYRDILLHYYQGVTLEKIYD